MLLKIIVIASLAKALGIPGGVILSEEKAINNIRQNPLFVGASPIVPAYLFAFLAAQPMYATARERLKNNIDTFNKTQTSNLFKSPFPHYPVFFTPENALFEALYKEKIFISHFAYPKPNDPPITRVVLSALHTEADIEYLTIKIYDFLNIRP